MLVSFTLNLDWNNFSLSSYRSDHLDEKEQIEKVGKVIFLPIVSLQEGAYPMPCSLVRQLSGLNNISAFRERLEERSFHRLLTSAG